MILHANEVLQVVVNDAGTPQEQWAPVPQSLVTDIMRGVTTGAALDSQAIEYSAIDAYWDAFRRDAEDIAPAVAALTSGDADIKERLEGYFRALHPLTRFDTFDPAPTPNTTTAPSCSGLTTTAQDGERLGRLKWTPGVR